MKLKLSKAGKEELAVALVLWKDFKTEGKMDIGITRQAIAFANMLGIRAEYEDMLIKLSPMKIKPRYKIGD
ncbi:unnamed protein product [marine sediment metagenome]|uniref:Uncharacterized protein n=1 Tax=marine sediment metagenome TaxID=412755 RepID=X0ZCX2_9ZZZZ